MDKKLADVLIKIGDEFREQISPDSRFYREVDIGKQAEKYGLSELKDKYEGICAIVPLKFPLRGLKVRVDGRTFVNYAQFESGIVVPHYVASEVNLAYRRYIPNDTLVRNFA